MEENERVSILNSDAHWERWGVQDPYYSVLTHPRFRSAAITPEALDEFFALGQLHVDHVLNFCRHHIDPSFSPRRVLDFGCGVGRLVLPFAKTGAEVVGVDISPSMLAEAQRNCERAGVSNVSLVGSDDTLSQVVGLFDLVHTCIVIQHIEVPRGLRIFGELVRRIQPGGVGAIQVTFAWDVYRDDHGVPPQPSKIFELPWHRKMRRRFSQWIGIGLDKTRDKPEAADPEMQMNFYNLSQLMFIVQQAGVDVMHSQLTDHGGAIGVFMFFRRPTQADM